MAKKKLIRFAENLTFPHLFQQSYDELMTGFPLKGKWQSDHFRNTNPIILELGCGKGEYTIHLAINHPEKNYIGLDIKGARIWRGAKTVEDKRIRNVAFIRTRIELIGHFFSAGEIDEIWITFPDPQPRLSRRKKRLTSPEFLRRYGEILRPGGIIHLKTDDVPLFDYTLNVINDHGHRILAAESDLYHSSFHGDAVQVQTFYEQKWLGKGALIKYLQFQLSNEG